MNPHPSKQTQYGVVPEANKTVALRPPISSSMDGASRTINARDNPLMAGMSSVQPPDQGNVGYQDYSTMPGTAAANQLIGDFKSTQDPYYYSSYKSHDGAQAGLSSSTIHSPDLMSSQMTNTPNSLQGSKSKPGVSQLTSHLTNQVQSLQINDQISRPQVGGRVSNHPGQRYPSLNGGHGVNGSSEAQYWQPSVASVPASSNNFTTANYPNQSIGYSNQQLRPGYQPVTSGGPLSGSSYLQQPSPMSPSQASYPHYQQQYQPQQYPQQTKSKPALDPDQMPSPIQVVEEDQHSKSGMFYTNQKGDVPPLVTTNFIVVDQGNASPRFIRSTMYNVPVSADMMKQSSVPFGLVISPMAKVEGDEQDPPIAYMGNIEGPLRCIRCKAYMSPNMQFIDGGRRFVCLLCRVATEVPPEYFQHLDHTGMRTDRFERPELFLGTYEYLATTDYCRDSKVPKPPALIFVIDVSYNNVKSGLVLLLCSKMKQILQNIPFDSDSKQRFTKVGFITYSRNVHFYNIHPLLAQPQMLVVGDVHDMFMPLLEGFLVDPVEGEVIIDALMEEIPKMWQDTKETEIVLLPAIQAGLEALKALDTSGKLLVFHSSLPTYEAPGKLRNRDDRKLLGTDKEKSILTPQNSVYNNLGQDCVAVGVSVDLFVFNNSYVDLATIGQVSRLTGGDIFKYTYFQADLDGERLISDVKRVISRLCAFDAVMRVRSSAGVKPTDFYGHFFMSNTTDIELASINSDKAVAVELKHDDKLSEDEGVFIQVALLYTSLAGTRKIRILNLSLKACTQMCDLYRTCELDTLMNFFSKQALMKISDVSPKSIKDGLISRSAQILACYRKNCASPTSSSQLVLPECMKLLPLYMNCLLKNDSLSGGSEMTVDDRWFMMAATMTMTIPTSVIFFYPWLTSLHNIEENVHTTLRCSFDKMEDYGAYLLDNGIYMFIWLGLNLHTDWVMSVFGVPTVSQVDVEKSQLPILNNQLSQKIRNLIASRNQSNPRSMRVTIVRQRDKMELVMKHFLVEDSGIDSASSPSYIDFLCHVHKEIRGLLAS